MAKCNLNGRFAAIFYILSVANVSAQTLQYDHETFFSSGGLSKEYWSGQNLSERPLRVVMVDDARLRLSADAAGQMIWFEHRLLGEYRGNSNVLTLAARPDADVKTVQTSNFPLEGIARTFEFDTLGLTLAHEASPGWTFSLSPQLVFLKKFTETNGRGTLVSTETTVDVVGNLNRFGMNSYGFAPQEQAVRFDPGWSLDLHASYAGEYLAADLGMKNLFSEISAQGLHYSIRDYSAHSENGTLNLGETPSVYGKYGQQNTRLSLPRIIQLDLSPKALTGWIVGGFSVENDFVPIVSYRADALLTGTMVQRIGDGNWRLTYSAGWLKTAASISVTWAAGLAPVWQINAASIAF